MVGDVVRMLVARTLAQQFGPQVEAATHPFQYALSTRAGTECVAHVVQALTSLDPRATILSIDSVGAYDTISRRAMMRGLADMADGDRLIPFVRLFYDSPSSFWWENEVGEARRISQGGGGEQGDPLMPLLFSVGQHRALVSVQSQLHDGERLFAFLDDIYVICSPERVGVIYQALEKHLWEQTGISIHMGKTKLWNAGGYKPFVADALSAAAQVVKPEAVVWRGSFVPSSFKARVESVGGASGSPRIHCRRAEQEDRRPGSPVRTDPTGRRCPGWMALIGVLCRNQGELLVAHSPS